MRSRRAASSSTIRSATTAAWRSRVAFSASSSLSALCAPPVASISRRALRRSAAILASPGLCALLLAVVAGLLEPRQLELGSLEPLLERLALALACSARSRRRSPAERASYRRRASASCCSVRSASARSATPRRSRDRLQPGIDARPPERARAREPRPRSSSARARGSSRERSEGALPAAGARGAREAVPPPPGA